jgi:hypothetical protein
MAEVPGVHKELRETTEAIQKPHDTAANSLMHKFRVLALLAAGVATAAGCSVENPQVNRPDIKDIPEIIKKNDFGPFQPGVRQDILSHERQTIGLQIGYSLSQDLENVTITAVGQNGETLYENEHDFQAGEGALRFVEPGASQTYTAEFAGASTFALITVKGLSENGDPFEFTVPAFLF